ncbi:molybdenum cofactor guanylyltransferase [uncultured Dysosmobacter sp.]|uniref:molybdenum cofactor guanylyltransferase n=1 Tax=uncultured Dysosmobacter sp. TaxID=2591384 RepID=UPI00345D0E8B
MERPYCCGKHFAFLEGWQRESALYTMLAGKLPLPDVLEKCPGVLMLEYCPFVTMLDVLERQEKTGPERGIVLAGGASRRMGQSKAELPLLGRSLLEWQVEKFRAMGIADILLSGENCPAGV